jgi:hypothetical protein
MLPSIPKVKSVTVITEMEDGRKHTYTSRANSIDQNEGVSIANDARVLNDELGPAVRGSMIDRVNKTTVTWTERWTDMVK